MLLTNGRCSATVRHGEATGRPAIQLHGNIIPSKPHSRTEDFYLTGNVKPARLKVSIHPSSSEALSLPMVNSYCCMISPRKTPLGAGAAWCMYGHVTGLALCILLPCVDHETAATCNNFVQHAELGRMTCQSPDMPFQILRACDLPSARPGNMLGTGTGTPIPTWERVVEAFR